MTLDVVTTVRRRATSTNKVPPVTAGFWITKALTTGMGESTSDYLVHTLVPEIAVALGAVAFAVALTVQLRAHTYVPWIYWTAVAMVGVFGTMCADVLHVGLGVPYVVSTILFAVVLVGVFTLWFRTERTLSVHDIDRPRREWFYWAAVVSTFALGTAVGDLTAVTVHLGYLASGVLFAGLILLPALGRRALGAVAAFWFAYVLTRPLGASLADWLAVSHARGGLDVGAGTVGLVLALAIVGMVVAESRSARA